MSKVIELNNGWWFMNNSTKKNKAPKKTKKKKWSMVTLPHSDVELAGESAWYLKRVKAKFDKKKSKTYIAFEGSSADFDVFINGKKVGSHIAGEDCKIDITAKMKKHLLINVMVKKSQSGDSTLNCQASIIAESLDEA